MVAVRIPNPRDEVRFLADLLMRPEPARRGRRGSGASPPEAAGERSRKRAAGARPPKIRGCAEGRALALQAGSPGAVPGDSTNLAVVAPRWSNRSVRDRARF